VEGRQRASDEKAQDRQQSMNTQHNPERDEFDVLNTYRVWLRHELFRGRLSDGEFQASETSLVEFVRVPSNTKPHLSNLM
jgi:hypothetical protein